MSDFLKLNVNLDPPSVGELDCIADQVEEHLLKSLLITHYHLRHRIFDLEREP